jgi:hypothetical protein
VGCGCYTKILDNGGKAFVVAGSVKKESWGTDNEQRPGRAQPVTCDVPVTVFCDQINVLFDELITFAYSVKCHLVLIFYVPLFSLGHRVSGKVLF